MTGDAAEFRSAALRKLVELFPDRVLHAHEQHGDATAVVPREDVLEVLQVLREDVDLDFDMLTDECGVDRDGHPERHERFEVVCHLYSTRRSHRLRVRIPVPESDPVIDSLTAIWKSANWFEREIWDMYGIRFRNHPDLRRLLLYDQFEGYPLRKDYPMTKRQPLVGPKN